MAARTIRRAPSAPSENYRAHGSEWRSPRRWIWLGACALCSFLSAPVSAAEGRGSLVIIGGALSATNEEVWSRFIELAGGSGAKIAVFPTAAIGDPVRASERALDSLRRAGGDPFLVPVAFHGFDLDYKSAVVDKTLAAQVKKCSGVFFIGGSQERITLALMANDGARTPLLDAVWSVYEKGGVIAGTSAGAAVMSRTMFKRPPKVIDLLKKGRVDGDDVGPGLGFLPSPCLVDQHFIARGRFARSLVAMSSQDIKLGVGVDEDTAVVVQSGVEMQVIGARGAILIDLNEAKRNPEVLGFNICNAKLSYLDSGDRFNLDTRSVDASAAKRKHERIDPNSSDFRPEIEERIVCDDILKNWAVVDLMTRLVRSKSGEAIGIAKPRLWPIKPPTVLPPALAFAPDAAHPAPTPAPAPVPAAIRKEMEAAGFEFRFYRGPDTLGWRMESKGENNYTNYTVANVRLDVRPMGDFVVAQAELEEK